MSNNCIILCVYKNAWIIFPSAFLKCLLLPSVTIIFGVCVCVSLVNTFFCLPCLRMKSFKTYLHSQIKYSPTETWSSLHALCRIRRCGFFLCQQIPSKDPLQAHWFTLHGSLKTVCFHLLKQVQNNCCFYVCNHCHSITFNTVCFTKNIKTVPLCPFFYTTIIFEWTWIWIITTIYYKDT